MTPEGYIDSTAYLVIEASRYNYGGADPETGLRRVSSARVAALRANRPSKLVKDQIAVKVTVRVPVSVFNPLTPEAVIVVPESLVQQPALEIEAVEPGGAE